MVKRAPNATDTRHMMISKEQARAAAEQLPISVTGQSAPPTPPVSPELVARAIAIARSTPAIDERRIAGARSFLALEEHDSRAVAAMMIQRLVSDSLR